MFGSTNPFGQSSASPFGQTSSNPFGAQQSAFGQTNAANPFGAQQSGFGQTNAAANNPFGAQQSAFGQTNTAAATTNPFGAQQSGFGQTNAAANNPFAPKPFGSPTAAFGAQTATSSPFGGTSTFGQPSAPAFGATSTGAFGQPSATAFGATSTGAFGQPSATGFGTSTAAFGQQSTPGFGTSNGAFGQQSTPPFGSTSTGAFGQQSTPGFGSTSTGAFGQPSTSAFGAPLPSPFGSSTSAFGASPAPAFGATTSNFGTGSMFGQKPSFGGFGSSPNQSSPFGSTVQQTQPTIGNSIFGTTTTSAFGATTTPAFGSTSTYGSTPFGSTTTPGFGSSGTGAFGVSSAPGFGASTTQSFGFGSSSTSAFSFGSSPSFGQSGAATGSTQFGTTPPFGSQTSPFGSQTAAPTFGQAPFGNQSVGTRIQPYVQTPDADGATSGLSAAKLDSISAMPAYKEKSHEELRWADYQRGDKGGPNSTPVVNNISLPQPSFQINQPAPVNPFSNSSTSTGAFGTTSSPFLSTVIGQTTSSAFPANTSQSPFTNTTPSIFNMPLPTSNPFNPVSSISNNSQSAGLIQSSPTIGQQPFTHSFNQQTSTPAFNTGIFTRPNSGMTGASSPFATPTFQQPAPVQPTSSFSFQPQAQPGGIFGVSNPVNMAPVGQQTTSQSNMVMQPTLVSNPFGTLPAMPQMSIGNGGSSPSVQYGISSLPVVEKPHPSRTLSMVVPRHLSQRRIKLVPRKYNATLDGKVPFFADDEESPVTPKADAFFTPRENPRSLIIRPADQWPSRSSVVDRQSIPTDSAHPDKDKDAFVGKERNKAAVSQTRYGPVENGQHASSEPEPEPEAVARHANGASIEKIVPKLSQADYFTEPSLEELAAKERAEPGYCCQVRDFVVGRRGYGSIKFLGETDVRGLDLESTVEFNNREVVVYKDDSKKPPVGEGLNKAAVVTLLNITCMDRKTGKQYTEGPRVDKFKELLVKTAEKQGAEFVSFDGAKGEWKFRVKNFSS